jgi:exodeoxyribonuclease V alpha subunit
MADDEPTTFALVEDAYLDAIRRVGVQHTGLLVPMRKGRRDTPGWNTTYLNARLQSVLNPGGQPIRGTEFRVGDRVIVRRNMALPHGDGVTTVVNGDTGTVLSQDTNDEGMPRTCAIQLDDTRVITLPAELLDLVTLAYAMTVHAAQGSEYHTCIVLMNNGSPAFLHRRVLYTAASRAREALILFGQTPVLSAIAKRPGPTRYSALTEKVLQEHHAC